MIICNLEWWVRLPSHCPNVGLPGLGEFVELHLAVQVHDCQEYPNMFYLVPDNYSEHQVVLLF
jgi:hypothetical protein